MYRQLAISITLIFFAHFVSAEEKSPIQIGWIGALSGNCAGVGQELFRGVELAVDEMNSRGGVNGQRVEVIAEDDGYNINRSITSYERLVQTRGIKTIFMSTYGALFAARSRAIKDGTIIIDTLDCNNDIAALSDQHFCVATKTESIADNFLKHITAHGNKQTMVLYEEEAWFNFIVNRLRTILPKETIFQVASEGAVDYRPLLLSAKQKQVENLIFLGNDPMGLALAQSRQLGIPAQFFSVGGALSPNFQKLAGTAIEGTIISFWKGEDRESYRRFEQLYQKKFGSKPVVEIFSAPSYDGMTAVLKAISQAFQEKGGYFFNKAVLSKSLINLSPFEGASGRIHFDQDGAVRTIDEKLFILRQGNLEPLP